MVDPTYRSRAEAFVRDCFYLMDQPYDAANPVKVRAVAEKIIKVVRSMVVYEFEDWVFSIDRRELTRKDGTLVHLTSLEIDILAVLCLHPQQTLSRDFIARESNVARVDGRSIDVAITRLRKKIESDPHVPRIIKTVRHAGYYFTPWFEE